jgi:hypothetical protein
MPSFTAVQFSSPYKIAADMRLMFVMPAETQNRKTEWRVFPTKGDMSPGSETFHFDDNLFVDVHGAEINVRNRVVFQPLGGGQIQPGHSYVFWLQIHHGLPTTVWMAVRLAPAGTWPDSSTVDELARDLGLPVPLRRNDVARWDELRAQVENGYRVRDAQMALLAAEEQIEKYPLTRFGLRLAANLSISRGEQIRDRGEQLNPNPYFFRAANYMRRLQQHFGALTAEERPGLAEALYFEAEAFAAQADKERALGALRRALDVGYDPAYVDLPRFQVVASTDELHSHMVKDPGARDTLSN